MSIFKLILIKIEFSLEYNFLRMSFEMTIFKKKLLLFSTG